MATCALSQMLAGLVGPLVTLKFCLGRMDIGPVVYRVNRECKPPFHYKCFVFELFNDIFVLRRENNIFNTNEAEGPNY